jgi:hypothetical protein
MRLPVRVAVYHMARGLEIKLRRLVFDATLSWPWLAWFTPLCGFFRSDHILCMNSQGYLVPLSYCSSARIQEHLS